MIPTNTSSLSLISPGPNDASIADGFSTSTDDDASKMKKKKHRSKEAQVSPKVLKINWSDLPDCFHRLSPNGRDWLSSFGDARQSRWPRVELGPTSSTLRPLHRFISFRARTKARRSRRSQKSLGTRTKRSRPRIPRRGRRRRTRSKKKKTTTLKSF